MGLPTVIWYIISYAFNLPGSSLAIGCLVVFVLFLTSLPVYARNVHRISVVLAFFLCAMSLVVTANVRAPDPMKRHSSDNNDISPAGLYSIYLSVTLLLYTSVPLPLYATVVIGIVYSALTEILLCRYVFFNYLHFLFCRLEFKFRDI